ncbi:MAG TPA: hypothetical protein VMW53_00005 [archaeon]|nr:hypothetical protein [archaeon]
MIWGGIIRISATSASLKAHTQHKSHYTGSGILHGIWLTSTTVNSAGPRGVGTKHNYNRSRDKELLIQGNTTQLFFTTGLVTTLNLRILLRW